MLPIDWADFGIWARGMRRGEAIYEEQTKDGGELTEDWDGAAKCAWITQQGELTVCAEKSAQWFGGRA